MLTLKEFLINSNPLQNYRLVSPLRAPHARARRVILANVRSECHFKMQIGYFGYCQIPLNAEKKLFCKILLYLQMRSFSKDVA